MVDLMCNLASVHANLRVFIDPIFIFLTKFHVKRCNERAERHDSLPIFESNVPVPVLDRSSTFRFLKFQMLMDFKWAGLRPVLDRSSTFQKFVPKVAFFVPKKWFFVPNNGFDKKT